MLKYDIIRCNIETAIVLEGLFCYFKDYFKIMKNFTEYDMYKIVIPRSTVETHGITCVAR